MSAVIDKNDIDAFKPAKKVRKYLYEWNNENYIFKCKTKTLNSIFKQCKSLYLIGFLSLHVERYEYNVFNGIDFRKNNFKFILIETLDLR
jgi:hypothetical protein